tara:strand:+ start:296 stop:565 length:270 start_codon:yes stop_codon:yes gene_type:complete
LVSLWRKKKKKELVMPQRGYYSSKMKIKKSSKSWLIYLFELLFFNQWNGMELIGLLPLLSLILQINGFASCLRRYLFSSSTNSFPFLFH